MAASTGPQMGNLEPKYDNYDFPTVTAADQPGHPGHTTPEQDAQVHQLRQQLEQEGYTDNLDTLTLLRFLRARKFNVANSKQMFIDCEKWRKSYANGLGVDELTRTFKYTEKKEVFQYYPQYYHKTDKDGRPVYVEHLGKIDLVAMKKIVSEERMLQNLVVEYEKVADPRLPACSRKQGNLLETCCTIFDMKGVGLSNASSVYGYMQQATGLSQNYYPERLGKLYVINAPWGFSGVFAVVKRFLDPVTVSKIHVLGSGYQSELKAQIPPENLPEVFGGTCKCPGGCEFSDAGPWQDPQYTRTPAWQKENTAAAGAGAGADAVQNDGPATSGVADAGKQTVPGSAEGTAVDEKKAGAGSAASS